MSMSYWTLAVDPPAEAVIEEAQSGCVTLSFPTLLPHFYGSVLVRIPFELNQKNPDPTDTFFATPMGTEVKS